MSTELFAEQFFFVHLMKCAGTTLRAYALRNFGPEQVFPAAAPELSEFERVLNYVNVRSFVDLAPDAIGQLRFISGHVPYAVAALACPGAVTIAVVRDPVERTLSYLRQCQRANPEHVGLPLEAIYADEWFYRRFIENWQTKMMGMDVEQALAAPDDPTFDDLLRRAATEGEEAFGDPAFQAELRRRMEGEGMSARTLSRVSGCVAAEKITVDAALLHRAKSALEEIDVLGRSEAFDQVLSKLSQVYGWRFDADYRLNRSLERDEAASGLRRRIAQDNWADMELYEHVRRIAG